MCDSHVLGVLQVLRGLLDFQSEPWPRISVSAKDCVGRLLCVDPSKRLTAAEASGAETGEMITGGELGARACYLRKGTRHLLSKRRSVV